MVKVTIPFSWNNHFDNGILQYLSKPIAITVRISMIYGVEIFVRTGGEGKCVCRHCPIIADNAPPTERTPTSHYNIIFKRQLVLQQIYNFLQLMICFNDYSAPTTDDLLTPCI